MKPDLFVALVKPGVEGDIQRQQTPAIEELCGDGGQSDMLIAVIDPGGESLEEDSLQQPLDSVHADIDM